MCFTIFTTAVKENRNSMICCVLCYLLNLMLYLNTVTRWLSLLRYVNRYLSQYDGLKSYFRCDDKIAKIRSIISRLQNPLTCPFLFFLSFILPAMDNFNNVFQKSAETTTCQMSRLVKVYICIKVINKGGHFKCWRRSSKL